MVQRTLIGYHPGFAQFGMWISKPGIDVLSTTVESNFLFSSTKKVHQIIMSGRIYCAAGFGASVTFPLNFAAKRPYIFFNDNQTSAAGGLGYYPHELNYGGVVGAKDAVCGCLARTNGITFNIIGGSVTDHYIDYIVFNTPIN